MAMRKLTKEEFCLVLQRIIYRLGPDVALRRDISDRQLYSGPGWSIAKELKADFKAAGIKYLGNEEMALEQAKREDAATINQTYIGRLLLRKDLRSYFEDVYHDDFLAKEAEYYVWAWASRAFVAAGSDKVITAVCGADENRIYRHEEQREMEQDRNYKTINDHFADTELDVRICSRIRRPMIGRQSITTVTIKRFWRRTYLTNANSGLPDF